VSGPVGTSVRRFVVRSKGIEYTMVNGQVLYQGGAHTGALPGQVAYYAAQAAAVDDPEWPALACLAKAAASETYLRAAVECIQLHGGIGFTWDNGTHLEFKRAKSSEVFLGQPSYHRELLI
jgi:alkylation response protein AidB-like acyl-CoA dehydrogenase